MEKKTLAGIIISQEEYNKVEVSPYYAEDMLTDIHRRQKAFAQRFHSLFVKRGQQILEDNGSATIQGLTRILQGNLACITNEVEEIREWLPWKHWKRYQGFDIELDEIRLEYIDLLHFVIEGMILLGMEAEDIHRYYLSKMKENLRRQESGY